jgi:hypothetical protein
MGAVQLSAARPTREGEERFEGFTRTASAVLCDSGANRVRQARSWGLYKMLDLLQEPPLDHGHVGDTFSVHVRGPIRCALQELHGHAALRDQHYRRPQRRHAVLS